jgi:hypothetical protein
MNRTIITIIVSVIVTGGLVAYFYGGRPATTTPVVLSDGYAVENGKVYYITLSPQRSDFEVKDADVATFEIPGDGWGKDAKNVFYLGFTTRPADASTPTIDALSFTSVAGTYFGKDNQAIYIPSFVYNPDGTGTYVYSVFPGADPATFVIVKLLMYAKDKSNVWYIAPGEGGPAREKMVGANPAECTADNLKGCEAQ